MEEMTREQLLELVARLQQTIVQLTQKINILQDEVDRLRKEAVRSAAPFRRRPTNKIPPDQKKKPGRPAGHVGVNRPVPPIIDEIIVVPLERCPQCQGAVTGQQDLIQYIEEIPVVRPHVTQLITQTGTCPCCGPVTSTHALQTGRGFRASATQLGPRALALAATLNKHHGLSMRKTCRVLLDACGLKLSPGGLSQALDRLADRLEPEYQQLFAEVRAGPVVYVDETSWWVNGPGHWLWVYATPTTTLYRVESSRSSSVVIDTLTPAYAGVLVSDCLNIYDDGVPYTHKHKCIAHHQKAIGDQLQSPGLRDRTYLEAWKKFFRQVGDVMKLRPSIPVEVWTKTTLPYYRRQRDELLSRELTQEEDKRIRNRLLKQQPYLLTCLENPDVDPTNNRAERELRPAVIARKVSCGNRTERGKTTWERLVSLAATWWRRGMDVVAELTRRSPLRLHSLAGTASASHAECAEAG